MSDRNSRVSTFEQLNAGQIIDSEDTRKYKVELETDNQDHHVVVVSRRRRYVMREGGNSFFWIAIYEKAVNDPESVETFYDVVDAITDTKVDRETTTVDAPPQPGFCNRIYNFFSNGFSS